MEEQKRLLEQKPTRNTIETIEEDSASLIVLRDESSFFSRYSDTLSRLSAVFDFDRELVATKVYDRANRGLLKKALRGAFQPTQDKDHDQATVSSSKLNQLSSKNIDLAIKEDAKNLKRVVKIAVLGRPNSGRDTIMEQIKAAEDRGYFEPGLASLRPTVNKHVVHCARLVVALIEELGIKPELQINTMHCSRIRDYVLDSNPLTTLGADFQSAVESLWSDPCVSALIEKSPEPLTRMSTA